MIPVANIGNLLPTYIGNWSRFPISGTLVLEAVTRPSRWIGWGVLEYHLPDPSPQDFQALFIKSPWQAQHIMPR